ncbi:MAG: ATP phosphoribosyltransferase [Chloroflexi bacterium]|nr:ATP phosphoribosyltransferase [Chloroflexota bacterium]
MPTEERALIRLSLPSKGRLAEDSFQLLEECGLKIYKPNPRQYAATIPALPGLVVLFQRPGDIVSSVRDGSVDFGITGLDVVEEFKGPNHDILILHDALQFGRCDLSLAVPESLEGVQSMPDLQAYASQLSSPLRVATKYPVLTTQFLNQYQIPHTLISAEGTLELAPTIGYADIISDLVSSGQTLRDNRLRPLPDGNILHSQAVLVANRKALQENPQALQVAHTLLEYIEAHLRAAGNLAIFANIRGESPEAIARLVSEKPTIRGLQGPTISPILSQDPTTKWFAINIIVPRTELGQAINELRSIGGSGVVVMPVTYIFEEEPPRFKAMLAALQPKA